MGEKDSLPRSKAELYERYEEALFRIALYELQQEEIDDLQAGQDDPAADEAGSLRTLRRIERAVARRHAGIVLRRTLPRVATVAACLVLVCFAGLTTVLAVNEGARRQVMDLMVSFGDGRTDLMLQARDEEAAQVPEDWMGAYYPAYIPPGYALESSHSDEFNSGAYYAHRRTENGGLSFEEYGENSGVSIDSSDASVRYTTVHGRRAILSVKPSSSFVSWSEGARFFIVCISNDDEATLMRVANSVERVA